MAIDNEQLFHKLGEIQGTQKAIQGDLVEVKGRLNNLPCHTHYTELQKQMNEKVEWKRFIWIVAGLISICGAIITFNFTMDQAAQAEIKQLIQEKHHVGGDSIPD